MTDAATRDRPPRLISGVPTHVQGQVAGERVTRLLYVSLLLGCVMTLAVLAVMRIVPRVVVLAPALLVFLRKPLVDTWRNERVVDIDARTARFESALLGFLLVAFVTGGGAD